LKENTYEWPVTGTAEHYFRLTVNALKKMDNTINVPTMRREDYEKLVVNYACYLAKKSGKNSVRIGFEDLGTISGNYTEASDLITLDSRFDSSKDEYKTCYDVFKCLHVLAHEHAHRSDFTTNPTTYVKFANESGQVPRLLFTANFAVMKNLFEEYSPAHDYMDRLAHSAYLLTEWEFFARKKAMREMENLLDALGGRVAEKKKSGLAKIFRRKPSKIQARLQGFIAETRKNEDEWVADAHKVKDKWGFVSDKFNEALRNYATVKHPYLPVTPSETSHEQAHDPYDKYETAQRDKQREVFSNDYCTFAEVLDSPYIRRQQNYDLYFNKTVELMREYAIGGEDAAYTMLLLISSPYNARSAEMLNILYTKALPGRMLDEFHANFEKQMECAKNRKYGVIAPAYVENAYSQNSRKSKVNLWVDEMNF